MSEKSESFSNLIWTLISIILAIFLFLSSFFIIYANEMMVEKSEKKTKAQIEKFYSEIFLWSYVKKAYDYRNSVVQAENWDGSAKWIIRLFWMFWFGFSLTLFFIPVFPQEPKDKLSIKAFGIAAVWVPAFIIILRLYLFYLAWWFKMDFSWIMRKPGWTGLSFYEKFLIIFAIVLVFVLLWYLYYYLKKKQSEGK